MLNIYKYLLEKLHLNKDFKGAETPPNDYFTDEFLPDIANSIKIETKGRGNKNKMWWAVYGYIYFNGPTKQKDIVQALKPGTNTQYAELFSAMRSCNILQSTLSGPERGKLKITPPDEWDLRSVNHFSISPFLKFKKP